MNNDEILPLFIHNKKIFSDYQLIGHDENALTYALGHCLSVDRGFLSSFLKKCQFKGITKANLGDTEIYLQKDEHQSGIVDLEIVIQDRLELIVEAKVGKGYPRRDQIQKYIRRLRDRGIQSKVIVLTKIIDGKVKGNLENEFGKQIGFLTWLDILELSQKLEEHEGSTFRPCDLSIFIEEVYDMRINAEEEVWIAPLAKWPAKSADISAAEFHVQNHFWVMGNRKTRRSIYMAFRYDGYLQYIGRIIRTDTELKSSEIVPKFPKICREFWSEKDGPYDVVRLEKLIPFRENNKLKSGNIHNRHIYCDLDLLLTADSIWEADQLMKKRRDRKKNDQ